MNQVKEDALLEVWGNLLYFCVCSQLRLNERLLFQPTRNSGAQRKL